jgi:aerobic-type carbon monoxide dehydrogenase small subunit (CoxS/CutS family)
MLLKGAVFEQSHQPAPDHLRHMASNSIEGLADDDKLHPVQAGFITHDAFQYGYCTPRPISRGND